MNPEDNLDNEADILFVCCKTYTCKDHGCTGRVPHPYYKNSCHIRYCTIAKTLVQCVDARDLAQPAQLAS